MIDIAHIIWIESSSDENIPPSEDGALGLCQIMPDTLGDFNLKMKKKYTVEMLKDPMISIEVCEWYLTKEIPYMLATKGLYEMPDVILACYNAGFGNYMKYYRGIKDLDYEATHYIEKYHRCFSIHDKEMIKAREFMVQYRLKQKGGAL